MQHRRLWRRKRRPLSRAFGIAVGGSGLRLLISEQLALGAANRRSMPPTSPPAASQGRSTALHQPRSERTAAAKQLRTSHRGAAALLSAAAAAGQPGPRRAPRPVSPGTAALAADARGARRPADTLNELRPLRPTCQPGGRHLPTRCHWLPALFGPLLPAVCSPMPLGRAGLLLADNPPSTHLTNPEPLDGARHEVSAVRVRPSPPNPTLAQPLLVRFCSR